MKENELLYITGCPGNYTAHLYNRPKQWYHEVRFMWYPKKEMIRKLRNQFDCVCPKGTY